jgi:uncharacterized protein
MSLFAMSGWLELMLSTAFVAGLMGSAHCAAMCGGISSVICAPRPGTVAVNWRFVLLYNTGRMASYAAAGALAGALGQTGLLLRGGALAQHAMVFFSGAVLVVLALCIAGVTPLMRGLEAAGGAAWRRIQPYSRRFLPVDSAPRALGLGAVWGWLPCGMVYAVLLSALASADARHGALVMLAFGMGTLPGMLAAALLVGRVKHITAQRPLRLAAAALVAAIGAYGMYKALQPAVLSGDGLLCLLPAGLRFY